MARSRDAPMDFEFTDRDRAQNVFAVDSPFRAVMSSPRKRASIGGLPQLLSC
jgi:hypothetical protein